MPTGRALLPIYRIIKVSEIVYLLAVCVFLNIISFAPLNRKTFIVMRTAVMILYYRSRYYYGFGQIHPRSLLNLNNRIDNLMTHVVVPITTSYFDTSTLNVHVYLALM